MGPQRHPRVAAGRRALLSCRVTQRERERERERRRGTSLATYCCITGRGLRGWGDSAEGCGGARPGTMAQSR